MSRRVLGLLTLVIGAALCLPAAGQTQACFRGRPRPTCASFWITETGYTRWTNPPPHETPNYFTTELGWMRNVSSRDALGGSLQLAAYGDFDWRLAFKPRYRRWLGRGVRLDVAPGGYWGLAGTLGSGIMVEAGLNYQDRVALVGRADKVGNSWNSYYGFKLGSQLGVAAAAVGAFVVGLLALTFSY
ncbi:MAG TPA: hypothetical protein VGA20_08825 [Gemmatimonadales bacterium]